MEIGIDVQDVCRHLGYKNGVEPSARIASLLDDYMHRARELARPACRYVLRAVKAVDGERALMEGALVLEGTIIARLLQRCESAAVFILTIGGPLEKAAGSLADRGLIAEAYVLDAIGSSLTEKLADYVEGKIGAEARSRGLCVSRRFSPGHCSWDIGQQRVLFDALLGDWVGVSLTDDCVMVPQKSVSGIIGIGPCDDGVDTYNPCDTCSKRTCPWRR